MHEIKWDNKILKGDGGLLESKWNNNKRGWGLFESKWDDKKLKSNNKITRCLGGMRIFPHKGTSHT